MYRFMGRSLAMGSTVLALTVLTPPAHAQVSAENKAAAEALFQQAQKLMRAKKYDEACQKFEQSQGLDPGIGTLLYLAECFEKVGRTASAWATFSEAASLARARGQSKRAELGEKRAKQLEGTLSKLTVTVAPQNQSIDGLVIRRGGKDLKRSIWGVPVPVDPGEHQLEASAPGYEPYTASVKIGKDGDLVAAEIPPLKASEAAAVAPVPAEPKPATVDEPPPADPPPTTDDPMADGSADDGAGQRTLGIVLTGVGIVGVGVGTVFGLEAISKNSDAEKFCSGKECSDPKGESLTQDAKDAAQISNIAFGVGAVGVIAGLVLILTAGGDDDATARRGRGKTARGFQMTPLLGPRTAGVGMRGSF